MSKLNSDERKLFVAAKFEEQRHLLRKSLKELVAGDLAEGIRIATIIRVLVHETGSSKPLLKQLTPNYLQLDILDRIQNSDNEKLPPGQQKIVVMSVPISISMSDRGVFLNPDLAPDVYSPSLLGKWWTRPALILPGVGGLSRKEIVLGLSNKEGGAHVDAEMSARYKLLMECKSLRVGWNKNEITPLNLSRLMAGQSANELLECLDRRYPLLVSE
jgi:hypothetical protein